MTEPLVSVVMLSFNRKQDVAEGIGELQRQSYKNIEIIVSDNGSKDNTAQMVREQFPGVHLIPLQENIGVAAYNAGFNKALGKYIVILDDDSFPETNAIRRMVSEFENNEKLGIVAFDVRNYYDYEKSNIPQLLPNKSLKQNQDNVGESPRTRYQMAFNGAGVGIRKECIRQVGGYPEEFFLYWNEQDLAIRILNAGYHLQWFTDIISFHKYSPVNRESWRAPFYYTRNLYWLIWKYFPIKKIIKDTVKLIYYSFYYTLDQKTLIYLKATFSALFNTRKIRRQPVKKEIVRNLRLTYRLPFIYYK
ncbi:MAG: glycosyltransferase family 2 protein [bacterium]|nr:glycosyltransferase family 2 protein [bacterium]